MLGAEQKRWFENELRTVTETFTVIVSSVPLRSGYKLRDHWEGYQRERRWMFDTIAKHGVKNVVFLTGDHHYAAIPSPPGRSCRADHRPDHCEHCEAASREVAGDAGHLRVLELRPRDRRHDQAAGHDDAGMS